MNGKDFNETVNLIVREDSRYEKGAYYFVRQALDYTLKRERKDRADGPADRHVSGRELCEGIREFALEQFGPMSLTLLRSWGLDRTDDFGQIVFNLVDYGVFGKTEKDSMADFEGIYDFRDTFAKPFEPRRSRRLSQHPRLEGMDSLAPEKGKRKN